MKSLSRSLIAVSLPVLVALSPNAASAATSSFCNFTDLSPLQLNGAAAQALGVYLRLTPNAANQTGSAYLKNAIPFPAGTSLHTYFRVTLSPNAAGADGIAFSLQNSAAGAGAIGLGGGSLGYGGLAPSVEVEFDTAKNAWDPSASHIAVMKNGDVTNHVAIATPPFSMTTPQGFWAWIDYDGASQTLQVFAASGSTKPPAPLITTVIDIANILGGTAYAGFTSATSASSNNHDVYAWELSTEGVPCKCGQDIGCVSLPTPACSATKNVCVQCSATNFDTCFGSTPLCDVPSGSCVACLTDADCGGATPICDAATKSCRPCAMDADCASSPGTPVCALQGPNQGVCVACTGDAECSAPTPRCDQGSNTCVACTSSADCGGITPICEPNLHICFPCISDADCGGSTPACQPSGACGQCSATNSDACAPPSKVCDIPSGSCVNCEKNADCAGQTPVCNVLAHTCIACKNDNDCNNNPEGEACAFTGMKKGACVPCTADFYCAFPTPKCDTVSNQCVACLTNANCGIMNPACDTTTHTCVGCVDDSTCAGNTPVCDVMSETCTACTGDYAPNNPPPLSCPTKQKPACETTGPLAGQCTQCDATNTSACPMEKPVCVTATDVCGCNQDADCPVDQYCNTAQTQTGQCDPGCHVVNGMDHCAPGETCSEQGGGVGICKPTGSSSTSTSSDGSSSAGQGGASSGAGQGGSASNGAGGAGHGGAGGAGSEGIVAEGGCACSVEGDRGEGSLALWAGVAMCAAAASRRRRRC